MCGPADRAGKILGWCSGRADFEAGRGRRKCGIDLVDVWRGAGQGNMFGEVDMSLELEIC